MMTADTTGENLGLDLYGAEEEEVLDGKPLFHIY